jgi:hypothetical protein
MSLQEIPSDSPEAWSTPELGSALVKLSAHLAVVECRWLQILAVFDRREGWRVDGQLSCVDWLALRCGLSRRTARGKLTVAHELRRRPMVAAVFAEGSISYSKVRAICRVVGADEETDAWLLRVAQHGTAADVERLAHRWRMLQDQERDLDDYLHRWDRRRVGASRTFDGMGVLEIVLPIEEFEEALTHLQVAVDEPGPAGPSSTAQARVDALLDLLRAGRAALGTPSDSSGADRYTVHAVVKVDALAERFGQAELIDGRPIGRETLRRLSCDCGIVRHVLRGASEPTDIGRRTSVWTAAQRRAIIRRDHGHCRFVGCWRRTCDIHHYVHYEDGGPTAVHNGLLLCPQHHTCVHEGGFTISGQPNGTLTFYRPDGTEVAG